MRIAVIASASGNGKTTLGRALAAGFDARFLELDAIVHGPGWQELPDDRLLAALEPVLSLDAWVIDGSYFEKLGTLVVDAADLVVWLDLPIRVWLPRLLARSIRRLSGRELLWNGNTETVRGILWGREGLIGYALRSHFHRRRAWPVKLRRHSVVRLRTTTEVERFLASVANASVAGSRAKAPTSGN